MRRKAAVSLKEKLESLYLTNTAERYPVLTQYAAKENLSHELFLERLIDEEIDGRTNRMIERRIREAKFPAVNTLEQYDFSHPQKINKQAVLKLFDLDFIERREWVIFMGNSGLGKTHLAKALGYQACSQGYRVLFTKTAHVLSLLQAAQCDNSLEKTLKRFIQPDLLILDEAGFLPLDQGQANLLFQVISDRYEYGQGATIITTNLAFKDWGRIFSDSVLAEAALDRIAHRCQAIKIEGESYRSSKINKAKS